MHDLIFLVKVNQTVAEIDILFYQMIQSKLVISIGIISFLLLIGKLQGQNRLKGFSVE